MISKERKRQQDDQFRAEELKSYQASAGRLNYLGHAVLPEACFVASFLQQHVRNLRVKNLMAANESLHLVRGFYPRLLFKKLASLNKSSSYLVFSDASQ